MSDDLIRRAREALKDVSPGPWSHNTMGEFGPAYDDDYQAFGMICDPVGECDWPNAVDNARFIAAARDLVPAMADRLEAQEALLAKATKLLAEADGDLSVYVGVEYPKELRAKYPSIERQWQRDMQLCREIDAFLKEIDNG